MNTRAFWAVGVVAALLSSNPVEAGKQKPPIDYDGFDKSVRPQDDFERFVNGGWDKKTEIPADQSRWGSFNILRKQSDKRVRGIIEKMGSAKTALDGDRLKMRDLYQGAMDEAKLNAAGFTPIKGDLSAIAALKSTRDVVEYMAMAGREGVSSPFGMYVDSDIRDPNTNAVLLEQSGLGLPNRDNYFDKTPDSEKLRTAYRKYVEKLFTLSGDHNAKARTEQVLGIENELAKISWTNVERRDAEKTYNPRTRAELGKISPAFEHYLNGSGLSKIDRVIVGEPSFFEGLAKIIEKTPVESWKSYLQARTLSAFAGDLGKEFRAADFEFHGKAVSGLPKPVPRWQTAVGFVNGTLGEAVGREYVGKYFKTSAKKRMNVLVSNLREAMGQTIEGLKWMDPKTKEQARQKLDAVISKIGYPEKWEDYAKLEVVAGDHVGNMRRAARFAHDRSIGRAGKPVDKAQWLMTPQTVNAYYNPPQNEIVFPAAILQPPFFNMHADDAVNYAAIGVVIGHELGHGFDDQGRKFDATGKLRDWWTKSDAAKFNRRANKLISQYSGYEPLPGEHLNGQLTLGENIGDALGMAMAYRAYNLSLKGKQPKKIDGYTGRQRFFLSFAQSWRTKARPEWVRNAIKNDPHSPGRFRVLGVLANFSPFHRVWHTKKEKGAMYKAPRKRVKIW